MSSDRVAPRVLLADDHLELLTLASSALRETCDVVAAVTNGSQAIDDAVRLDPDTVILDVNMPGLDGFQTARELRRRGSRARIVFLSMHDGDEFVVTAFRSGGQALVSKLRMATDLPSAVEHVQAGRVFLPSLSSLSAVAPRGGHAVMFYSRHDAWCDEAARLVRAALTRGDGVVLFAPDVTRTGIENRLKTYRFDTTQAVADQRYIVADAAETLQRISCDGRPDAGRIAEVLRSLEDLRLAPPAPRSRMTVVGEVATCVGPEHRDEDMLSVERLWNQLVGERPFLSVCGYSMDTFPDSEHGQLWPNMCAEHWAVCQSRDQ